MIPWVSSQYLRIAGDLDKHLSLKIYSQEIGQLPLRIGFFFSCLCDENSDFNLIHRENSFLFLLPEYINRFGFSTHDP